MIVLLRTVWKAYLFIKGNDYTSGIEWTNLQITLPEESLKTPKAMENAFDVWGGLHKSPDVVEMFLEGYVDAWYSCEIQCEPHRVRYMMVVPAAHRKFFEGVIYGQYPSADIREVEDYSLNYSYADISKTFDMYGSEIRLTANDYLPIRTYDEFEDSLNEDEKYIDPHQSLIEAFTNIQEGEQFWMQVLVRPVHVSVVEKWADKGEEEVGKIAGTAEDEAPGLIGKMAGSLSKAPGELLRATFTGPTEAGAGSSDKFSSFKLFTPVDEAKMKGIFKKIGRVAYKTKIRVVYISPAGKYRKPAQSVAHGAFKQFNTFHLNSFAPDSKTKTSGPTYFLKETRRKLRKRRLLLEYQWREFADPAEGQMMTADELATLYHFPVKYLKAPAVERALSGLGSAPENLPYA